MFSQKTMLSFFVGIVANLRNRSGGSLHPQQNRAAKQNVAFYLFVRTVCAIKFRYQLR